MIFFFLQVVISYTKVFCIYICGHITYNHDFFFLISSYFRYKSILPGQMQHATTFKSLFRSQGILEVLTLLPWCVFTQPRPAEYFWGITPVVSHYFFCLGLDTKRGIFSPVILDPASNNW